VNQMYHEVWRIERDFLYDPNHHGLDIPASTKVLRVSSGVGGRDDLNYLFEEMLGEITIGHMFVGGGDSPQPKQVKGGLLGADYKTKTADTAWLAFTTVKTEPELARRSPSPAST